GDLAISNHISTEKAEDRKERNPAFGFSVFLFVFSKLGPVQPPTAPLLAGRRRWLESRFSFVKWDPSPRTWVPVVIGDAVPTWNRSRQHRSAAVHPCFRSGPTRRGVNS